jgi:hypothetical protein
MPPHLLRYQGFAVDDYGFVLDALNLGHPRLSIIQDINNKQTPLLRKIIRRGVSHGNVVL